MERLHNDDWGFETNCFVCERRNPNGLRLDFFHAGPGEVGDGEVVICDVALGEEHSGAPGLVHGGVLLAVADEAMAWAVIAIARRLALTASTSSDFLTPVATGVPHRMIARIDSVEGSAVEASARLVDLAGCSVMTSSATFVVLSDDELVRRSGASSGDLFRRREQPGAD